MLYDNRLTRLRSLNSSHFIIAFLCSLSILTTTTTTITRADSEFSDLSPSIFAPGGRLFSVERTLQAVNLDDPMHNLVIAIQCRDGIVVVTSQVVSPYLLTTNLTTSAAKTQGDSNETTTSSTSFSSFPSLLLPDTGVARPPFCRLSTRLWGITAGNAADAQLLRLQMHGVAESIRMDDNDYDDNLLARQVARSLADRRQLATQQADEDGLLNATAVVFDAHDNELWRVEPTGQFFACQAAIVGRKAHVAEADLLMKLSNKIHGNQHNDKTDQQQETETEELIKDPQLLQQYLASLSREDTLKMAVECIRNTFATKKTSVAAPAPMPISLKALLLHDDKAEWMSEEEL